MFSTSEFVDASRKFVCVRLESYESEKHQKMVRSFLDGRFENTAFCLLAPDGEERLSSTGRGPHHAITGRPGRQPGVSSENPRVIEEMENVARRFKPRGGEGSPVIQDFHSVKQSVNVASADQRLLVLVNPEGAELAGELRDRLGPVMADPGVVGRFHVDFVDAGTDAGWEEKLGGQPGDFPEGILIVEPTEFGLDGKVIGRLPPGASGEEIKEKLLAANRAYAAKTERKIYSEHVIKGRRTGVYLEGNVEYGEDRDGDGVIDHRGPPHPRQGRRRPPPPGPPPPTGA